MWRGMAALAEGVRNIPYGIQQPAVSGQIAQLEEYLGTTLFQRRPFLLTPPGEKLYRFIEPFFTGIDALAGELQGGTTHQLRIGASDIIFRDHLPEVLLAARRKFPQLKVTLRDGYQPELESLLLKQEIDMAVTVMEKKSPAGIQSQALLELPLILVVPKGSPLANGGRALATGQNRGALDLPASQRNHLQKLPARVKPPGNRLVSGHRSQFSGYD